MSIHTQWIDSENTVTLAVKPMKVPLAMRVLRSAIRIYSLLSAEKAGRFVNRLWFTPTRTGGGATFEYLLDNADSYTRLRFGTSELPVYSWGSGPVVLMVHGWSGAGIQFGPMIEPLVQRGYRVVVFDAPGHGRAQGERTHIFEMSEAVAQVADLFGQIHGIVGHSLGAVAAVLATTGGLPVNRLALMAPPLNLDHVVDLFGSQLAIPQPVLDVHAGLLEEEFGAELWQRLDMTQLVRRLEIDGLVVSDIHDVEIPSLHGELIAGHWQRCRFLETRNLGHYRILKDSQVLEELSAFLDG
ncbi:alpha/beta hydrolase [Marinobacter changyiensis]|uniref:alpha/beta hydrolase n=1 Tax=Marinobacter changyiensis TaxID=2604091 RepID=UPI0012653738|nr:alpha/beta fold hydrolase [Marinobacter changyiensis]